MVIISAAEARQRSFKHAQENPSDLLIRFFEFVANEVVAGNFSGIFDTAGQHLSNEDYAFITLSLGYSLQWNSACLWYEVSW